jgi:hypothetical protein
MVIGDGAERGEPRPPKPKATPKKRLHVVPTLPGTSSCE